MIGTNNLPREIPPFDPGPNGTARWNQEMCYKMGYDVPAYPRPAPVTRTPDTRTLEERHRDWFNAPSD
jgi:hypothetical protein